MKYRILNQLSTLCFTIRTYCTFGKPTNLQKANRRISKRIKKYNLHSAEILKDLTTTWNNGWYVTKGDDPRKNTCYREANCDASGDKNHTIIKIEPNIKTIENQGTRDNQEGGFLYSGVMKYSAQQFRDGIFAVEVNIEARENAKFAFWLKNFQTDVNEIDVVEVFNNKIFHWFGKKLMKAVFTLHTGTSYQSDHKQSANSIIIGEGYHLFELERLNGKLIWRVDGFRVKTEPDPNPAVAYGVILDYEASGIITGNTAVISKIKNLFVNTR
jgi:hypothetical protein